VSGEGGGGKWVWAREVGEVKEREVGAWYNLVVRGGGSMVHVGEVETVGLGHELTEGILNHAYFGTKAVQEDLAKWPGYAEGRVKIAAGSLRPERGANGLIVKLF
jgi:hypothetical protein